MTTLIATLPNGRQLIANFSTLYSCPAGYDVGSIINNDISHDCNIQPEPLIEVLWADDEPLVYRQIGTVEIDGETYGVVGLTEDEGGAAVCENGHPSEILFLAGSDRADWSGAGRAMVAAGFWAAA